MNKTRKTGLGKGLDSLIPEIVEDKAFSSESNEGILMLSTNLVEPNREQPRKEFNKDALTELSESIRLYGILQPILVLKKDKYYEIIAGERRWRAAKMAGLKEVPVIIKDYDDREVIEISLIENIQREKLNPIEEAKAYKKLIDEFELKQEDIAQRVSKSRSLITNTMRLLKLAEDVQQQLISGSLSTGHARALLGLDNPKQQNDVALKIIEHDLSVRETEAIVKKLTSGKQKAPEKKANNPIFRDIEKSIENIIGTKVRLSQKAKGKGKIEIEYYSDEDLDRILEMLMKIDN
ncbi:ParB/RepB/Spo0J family partition protein [Parasporobacterium paucivorans]|uniref:Chromosome partitioning protein, ParB family n=1 Tax=Parasporobacterium paucivorans DSM 15970 TaxID=1122934 RepID=A0A1M6B8W8_9FIRM|nr:ParB/RepB/Spo0J family partition protein [Parasporobacterium paucivorans]SHI45162.1 chromosome partitioning protein, ParB family [Parasporobacterium paucivorans DSM 15970]